MKIKYQVLDATKAGSQRAEMEDASHPAHGLEHTSGIFACAVADGATQGSHSGPWARFLCEEFAAADHSQPAEDVLNAVVPAARASFAAWEKQYLAGREAQGRPLQWFEEEVTRSGAFATLVGLHLEPLPSQGAKLRALALGDSCLFIVRAGQVAESFPLTDSSQFAGAPLLIASLATSNSQMLSGLRCLESELAPGDSLLLCTDALAAWVLREKEQGKDPVSRLMQILASDTRAAFDDFLAALRQDKLIRNDDVTLAHVLLEI